MNDRLTDEFLYIHIPRAEASTVDSIPAENELDHTFSSRFLRKMQALLKYERRGTFGRFAAALGRVVAAVLVAVLLLNTVQESSTLTTGELIPIEPSYIPEGFEMVEKTSNADGFTVIYRNDDGQEIQYLQSFVTAGEDYIDAENKAVETVQINEYTVYAATENGTTQIIWFDGAYVFQLVSNAEYETVITFVEEILK